MTAVLSIMIVMIVLLIAYYVLGCTGQDEITETKQEEHLLDDKPMLTRETVNIKYPVETKDENAIVVDGSSISTAMNGTVTIETLINLENILEPKKRKPRKKTRTCENCANFIPIKEPKKRVTKIKEDENGKD